MKKQSLIAVFITFLLVMAWISINIYLPALPTLVHYFSTSELNIKFAATLFLAGYTCSQIVWGPLSEKFGRRKLIFIGLSISLVGLVLVISSKTLWQFDAGRFLEALGLGCAPGLGRAMVSDSFDAAGMAKVLAISAMCANIMPGIAPLLGINLLHWFNWQAIFVFIAIYTVGVMMILLFISETHKSIRTNAKIMKLYSEYLKLLENKKFIGYLMIYLLLTGAMISFYTITPFIFIDHMHVSEALYSNIMIALAAFYILGALTVKFLAHKIPAKRMIIGCLCLDAIAVIGLFILPNIMHDKWLAVVIAMAFYMFSAGIISPTCNTAGIKLMQHIAGVASAALGVAAYVGATIQSAIINNLNLDTHIPLATFFAVVVLLAIISYSFLIGYQRNA